MWRDIPGYNGRYQASESGQISRVYKNGKRKIFSQYKKQHQKGSTRLYVKLSDGSGKSKDVVVHQIILLTYVGPCPDGMIAYHKNGVYADNYIANLEYIDKKELGRRTGAKSRRRPVVKMNCFCEIVEFYKSAREAARQNHMSYQTVMDCCNQRNKKVFAPDGYAYSWDDDEKSFNQIVRRIELTQGYMPKAKKQEYMW